MTKSVVVDSRAAGASLSVAEIAAVSELGTVGVTGAPGAVDGLAASEPVAGMSEEAAASDVD